MSLPLVPDTGVFTKRNQRVVNSNFAALTNPDLWIRPQGPTANNNNVGSYESPLASPAGANKYLKPGMVIGLEGVIQYEWSTPMVNDITLIGMANRPRQATTSSIPNGGGATWLSSSATASTSLLQPNGQGWRIENIFFASGAGVTAAPTIKLVNAGDPPTSNCSEKTSIINCFITGTDDGIGAVDLPNNILIDGCTIFSCNGSGDLGISSTSGLGTGTLNNWVIQNCDFLGNAGHITAPFTSSVIRNNHFSYIFTGVTSTTQVVLTSGSNNSVYDNHFDVPATATGLAAMFALGTNDRWSFNELGTAVATTIYAFGGPAT